MSGQNNEKTPALQQKITTSMAQYEEQLNKFIRQLQDFQGICNTQVEADKLEDLPKAKGAPAGVKYLPISFMEMTLDEIYFGMWETVNFQWKQIGNEIAGSLDLRVFHPVAKQWLTRTGAGAAVIMTDAFTEEYPKNASQQEIAEYKVRKNKWALNLDNKKAGALQNGGFAAFKADCFKNACLSLGKYFGRDVNRKHFDNYNPLVPDLEDVKEKLMKELSDLVALVQDKEMNKKLIEEINEAEDAGRDTVEFYKKMIKKLKRDKND